MLASSVLQQKFLQEFKGSLTGGPGGPTRPADPGKPVGPWRQRQKSSDQKIMRYCYTGLKQDLTGAPCVPLPPFSPATPTGPYSQKMSMKTA